MGIRETARRHQKTTAHAHAGPRSSCRGLQVTSTDMGLEIVHDTPRVSGPQRHDIACSNQSQDWRAKESRWPFVSIQHATMP